jgi:hypothetical protein
MTKFSFGDLVSVSGYHPRVFRIDGYHEDTWHYPGETWTEVVFDLVDVHSGVFIEAETEDLTLISVADKADEYLANNPAPAETESESFSFDLSEYYNNFEMGSDKMAKKERQPTARELSAKEAEERKAARKAKAEEIDNLLDRRNWYAVQFAKSGSVEDNEKVQRIDTELAKLSGS